MALLNDPPGYEPTPGDAWSPARGVLRALWVGGLAALLACALAAPVAIWLPFMLIPWLWRAALALGVALLLNRVVQSAAGMSGPLCRWMAFALTVLWLVSHHVWFAVFGVPTGSALMESWTFPGALLEQLVPRVGPLLIGREWLGPGPLLLLNGIPLVVLLTVFLALARDEE